MCRGFLHSAAGNCHVITFGRVHVFISGENETAYLGLRYKIINLKIMNILIMI